LGKVAVVSGASTGIGQVISLELARAGAVVFLVARNRTGLLETKALIEEVNGKCEMITTDLADTKEINNLVKTVKQKTKRVDILVNVAGIWHGKDEVYAGIDFENFSEEVVLDTFAVGLVAPTLLAHGFIPLMGSGGKIINISGTFENGAKGWLPYYVSKRGIEDLTIGLADELKRKDIQVNAISPSDTATNAYKKYFPQYMDEAVNPAEIASQVIYLCSDSGNKITGKVFVIKKGREPYEGFHS
jgi:2-dehydro-3-deoxy-D-gluconate 5-dehydrogenase